MHVFVCTYTQRTFCYWHTHTFTHLISPAQTLSYCNIQPFSSDGWFLWITNISKLLASHQLHTSHQFLGRNFIDNHTSTVSIFSLRNITIIWLQIIQYEISVTALLNVNVVIQSSTRTNKYDISPGERQLSVDCWTKRGLLSTNAYI